MTEAGPGGGPYCQKEKLMTDREDQNLECEFSEALTMPSTNRKASKI